MTKQFFKSVCILAGIVLFNMSPAFAQSTEVSNTLIGNGIGMGSALAIAICWSRTHSVLTSIIAGVFGWLYVIYFCIIRETENR